MHVFCFRFAGELTAQLPFPTDIHNIHSMLEHLLWVLESMVFAVPEGIGDDRRTQDAGLEAPEILLSDERTVL